MGCVIQGGKQVKELSKEKKEGGIRGVRKGESGRIRTGKKMETRSIVRREVLLPSERGPQR